MRPHGRSPRKGAGQSPLTAGSTPHGTPGTRATPGSPRVRPKWAFVTSLLVAQQCLALFNGKGVISLLFTVDVSP